MPIDLAGLPLPLTATPLERNLRRLFAGALIVALVGIVAALAVRSPWSDQVVIGSVIVLLALGLAAVIAARRSRRVLIASSFLVCPRCLSRLDPSAAQGRCPTCGFAFESAESLETLWREIYRVPR